MKRLIYLFWGLLLFPGIQLLAGKEVQLNIIPDYKGWGWEALVVENGYIELVIIPEIGGRVMYYNFPDDEYMAVNEEMMGRSFDPASNKNGPWAGTWGYGGYKNWPAPQTWNWPPPPNLCWGPYSYTIEHNVPGDSVVIYLESVVETTLTPGLKQARRFHVYPNSTLVRVDQFLINTATATKNVAVWDITQAIVQHGNDADYEQFSVYFPASSNHVKKAWGSNFKMKEIDPGVHQFTYTRVEGKYNINLYDGWCSFVDERDAQSYLKLFGLVDGVTYPDENSNFEIYSSGGSNYIEIEVLGPQERIGQNEQLRLDEFWYAAKIDGPTLRANHQGAVRDRLMLRTENATISGTFGLFFTGSMVITGYNETNEVCYESERISFEAGQKVELNLTVNQPEPIARLEALVFDSGQSLAGAIDVWEKEEPNSHRTVSSRPEFRIDPSVCRSGESIRISVSDENGTKMSISLHHSGGKKIGATKTVSLASGEARYMLPDIPKGIYILRIQSGKQTGYRKILIKE
ncbi:MAG TPA: T9SS type A sorting domain-containing protein [Prolixibacteraceae bacterium]|nr:T9SS type A sorting domain-containing protein [Prolixibacteraceae bacterium]